jgi:DNA-binding Xre family transcriptional regulator
VQGGKCSEKAGTSAYRRTAYFHRTHNKGWASSDEWTREFRNADNNTADVERRPMTRSIAVQVAQRIRRVLDTRGLSVEWLADATGIKVHTLTRRLHLTRPCGLTVDELNAIAGALDVAPGVLLRNDQDSATAASE